MTGYIPLSRERHQSVGVSSVKNYKFATEMSVIPILKDEVASVIGQMCLAFREIRVGEQTSFELVAVQSLKPKRNLFVMPDGRWLKGYCPAFYRAFPFTLLPVDQNTVVENGEANTERQLVLAVNEDAIKTETGEDDFFFYDDHGELTQTMQDVVRFLRESLKSKQATLGAGLALADSELMVPWPIQFRSKDDVNQTGHYTVEGLFHIDAQKLKSLSAYQLVKLNKSDALSIAYAQLFSEVRLKELAVRESAFRMFENTLKEKQESPEVPDLENLFGDSDDLLSF